THPREYSMKSTTIVCALAAASLGIGSLSFAQGYERDRRDDDRQGYQQRDHDRRDGDRDRRADNDRRDRREGMGNRGDLRRGGRIPPEYRRPQYVVHDWRAHRLHAPPRGYQWVQVGSDYVLVAVATGIIAQLLLSQ